MDVYRRNIMKGALTGGTLLAMGIPPGAFASAPAKKAGSFGLLLGNTRVDSAFAAGFRTAYAGAQLADAGSGQPRTAGISGFSLPQVVKLKGGLLNDYEMVADLLEKSRNIRWVAVMDDGSAAVFMELARSAGAELLLLGSHTSSDNDADSSGIPHLRSIWAAASPAHSAAGTLASQLVTNQASFSIAESFFSPNGASTQAATGNVSATRSMQRFMSYRLDGPNPTYLHCSGVLPADGCKLLGWNRAGSWAPVSQRELTGESAASNGQPRSADWVESIGYALMSAALENGALQEPCSSRAFVHRPAMGKPGQRISTERFTSFVIDI